MITHYRSKFYKALSFAVGIILGGLVYALLLLWCLSVEGCTTFVLSSPLGGFASLVAKLMALGTVVSWGLYVWSHYLIAKAKGYSGWFSLLCLVPLVGLLILFLLPDQQRQTGK